VTVAQGRSVVDFGARRMPGADAALKQPRAFYVGGVDSTSSVIAADTWGIPVAGTMAHSYVLAFDEELAAFRHFTKTYPSAILLVDTYDVYNGVQNVIRLSQELGAAFRVSGVRLDSGDLAMHARAVRAQLNSAGLTQVKIFVSSSLDEYEIHRLVSNGVPIDGFGVGRHLATSSDVPVLDTAYKLTEYAGKAKMKMSESKATLPGRKQVFRQKVDGHMVRDVIALTDESNISGEPLLVKVMENGRRLRPAESLENCRARCKAEREALPAPFHGLSKVEPAYPVELSPAIRTLITTETQRHRGK
jgi:nicotinate phosphoribosyltransferase